MSITQSLSGIKIVIWTDCISSEW